MPRQLWLRSPGFRRAITGAACASAALVSMAACSHAVHDAYTGDPGSEVFNARMQDRARDFVAALGAGDATHVGEFTAAQDVSKIPAFLAAYAAKSPKLIRFERSEAGSFEAFAVIQVQCAPSKRVEIPQEFTWIKNDWRTYLRLPAALLASQRC